MKRAIVIAILKFLGLSVRKEATKTPFGIEGEFSLVFKIFPMIGILIFGLFGVLALRDPDPQDQAVSILGFGLVALCIGITIHRFTFLVQARENQIRISSLVVSERVISLVKPFEVSVEEDGMLLKLRQGKEKIVIAGTMNGYHDFFDLVVSRVKSNKVQQGVDLNT